jgi:hypothetical protein
MAVAPAWLAGVLIGGSRARHQNTSLHHLKIKYMAQKIS